MTDTAEKSEFDRLMTVLGSVVVIWGMVEDAVRRFTADVLFEGSADDAVEQIVLSEIALRNQIEILRKVAYVRRPDGDWFTRLDTQLKAISTSMHDRRNRYIHDLWEQADSGEMMKFLRGRGETAVSKKGGAWQLKLSSGDVVPADEVEAFFEEVADACEQLVELKAEYVQWRYEARASGLWSEMKARAEQTLSPDGRVSLASLLGTSGEHPFDVKGDRA